MEDKIKVMARRLSEIENELSRPDIVSDMNRYRDLNRERSQLAPVVRKYEEYLKYARELEESRALLRDERDEEMREMLRGEIALLEEKIVKYEEELLIMLLPRDPSSGKDVIMEIRAGTGGDEAALFAADLFRMYTRYADLKGMKIEFIEANQTEIGGYKEMIFSVRGEEAYDSLKYESGVHRVQRVPTTESGGRVHTSAVTVAVMPEAEESEIEIDPNDLRIDVYRSSGHGGQSVNTTDSAVRITHIPTGMIVTCQDEKSQHKNKAKALRVLRARLYEIELEERLEKESDLRRSQVGSGDRSERIRTYNFPQSRVTDHRVGVTLYSLESFLAGEMDDIIDALRKAEIEQKLKVINS
ncbi:MAG TPA: peptide chain release factor 1 [Spirochaetota bacterium]|nr:peptide chain release factor 1 [Spirochaetota bacterium]HPI90251.1 peptide chain release factor 1 [Spirochaetota bacterium]HPR46508.1 peptide chain release factor 1 [Spirochaetota bacterium]